MLGYFVQNGKFNFCGAVKGVNNLNPYNRIVAITRGEGTDRSGDNCQKITAEKDIQEFWDTMLLAGDIPEVWNDRREWWTVPELQKVIGQLEAEQAEEDKNSQKNETKGIESPEKGPDKRPGKIPEEEVNNASAESMTSSPYKNNLVGAMAALEVEDGKDCAICGKKYRRSHRGLQMEGL